MKHVSMLLMTLLIAYSSVAVAGEIYGTLREGGKAVAKGIKVEVVTPKKSYTASTDAYGSYRLYVPEKGKCTFNVYYKNQVPAFELYSYEKSTRYDMSLEMKDTTYYLKRK